MYRFFVPTQFLEGDTLSLSSEEHHHAKKVLRVRPNEPIELVNGLGQLATALFDTSMTLITVHTEPPPTIASHLIQAFPEKGHLEWIVEKGTELGLTDIHLFPAIRSKLNVLSPNTINRLHKLLVSALKQCKRLFLPTLHIHETFPKLDVPLYLADPSGERFLHPRTSAAMIVGPESGFTAEEKHLFSAKPVRLSANILRVETASVIAAHLLMEA